MAFNKAILEGRLCAEPDMRTSQSGMNVCRFRVAVDRQKRGEADFISCVAFGKTAEFIGQYFTKGKPILVEGHITVGSYTDKDGVKRVTTDVTADRVAFTVSDKNVNALARADAEQETMTGYTSDEDLPF